MFFRSISAVAGSLDRPPIHPVLRSFGDECGDALIKVLAYLGTLALLAALTLYTAKPFVALLSSAVAEPAAPSFVPAPRTPPAFAVSQAQFPGKTASYEVLRHPDGGRKDVMRWAAAGEPASAELVVYRPGTEAEPSASPFGELPEWLTQGHSAEIQPAGVIDSKFGTVMLATLIGDRQAAPCLGFAKRFDQPRLALSGWSCQSGALPEQRAAVGCLLDRLMLLGAGGDPALAELFARAELRRGACQSAASLPTSASNWVTGPQNPLLRGSL